MASSECLTDNEIVNRSLTELLKIVDLKSFCEYYHMDLIMCTKVMARVPGVVFSLLRWMKYPSAYGSSYIEDLETKLEVKVVTNFVHIHNNKHRLNRY